MEEETVSSSKFSKNSEIVSKLKSLGVISIERKGRRGTVSKGQFFDSYTETHYKGNPSLFLNADSRAELIVDYGDDKAKKIAPQKGLFVWSEQSISLTKYTSTQTEEGVVTFLHERLTVTLPSDVVIVGVENFETLTYATRLKEHFMIPDNCLFVYRNALFGKLIKSAKQDVLYIPDYDIFGIRIYETEVLKNNASTTLLIPKNIEKILGDIDTLKKYLVQRQMKGGKYDPISKEGREVMDLLSKHKKIIPQEYFHSDAKDNA